MTTIATPVTEVCSALGDETRWSILQQLSYQPSSASALAQQLPISRQAVTQHLAILLAAGLVERRRHGREIQYQPIGSTLSAAVREIDALAAGWDQRLSRLKQRAETSTRRQADQD